MRKVICPFGAQRVRAALGVALVSTIMLAPDIALAETVAITINLRSNPDLQSTIVGVLNKDTEVKVLRSVGEFAEVERVSNGRRGYLKQKYLIADTVPVPVPAPEDAAVRASTPVVTSRDQSRWSLALFVGQAQSGVSGRELESKLQPHARQVNVQNLDESQATFGALLEYRLFSAISIAVGVIDLGEYQSQITISGADDTALQRALQEEHPAGGVNALIALTAVATRKAWYGSLSGGLLNDLQSDKRLRLDDGNTVTLKSASNALWIQGTGGYRINDHFGIELFASQANLNQRLTMLGLGLRYTL